jgi:membrane-associated phospholipid phosphatase
MPDTDANTPLEQAELDAAKRLGAFRDHPVARLLGPVSKAADQPPMLGLAAAALVVGLFGGLPRVERAGAQALASVALATAVKHLIKHTVTRSRPHKLIDEGEYRRETGASGDKGEQSFPSGHTADAVAAARAVARVYPGLAIPVGGFAVLAGAAQPLRAAHYLSDVAAGATIGWAAEHCVEQARRWFASRFAPG